MTKDSAQPARECLPDNTEKIQDYLSINPAVLYVYRQYVNGGGRMKFISDNCEEVFGVSAENFIKDPETMWDVIHPDDRDRLREEDVEGLHDPFFSSDVRIITPSGEEKWVRLISRPSEKSSTDEWVTWIGSVVDVTDKMQAKAERDSLIRDLEFSLSKIRKREVHLKEANASLRDVKENLTEKNNKLDQFAQVVAHDLNSMINSIAGYSAILMDSLRGSMNEDNYRLLEDINASSFKVSEIIQELLKFARIDKQMVSLSAVRMSDVIQSAEKRLQDLIIDRSATILISDLSDHAVGYAPWLEEVWLNLLSNAIKYGGNPPVITVGSYQSGDMITFWIEDNGKGLNPSEVKALFDKGSDRSMDFIKGHGLGLDIVKQIIEELGGQVGVSSHPGKGSRLRFSLPRVNDLMR